MLAFRLTSKEKRKQGTAYTGATFSPWRTRASPPPSARSATAFPAPYRSQTARNVPSIRASPTWNRMDAPPGSRPPVAGRSGIEMFGTLADCAMWWNQSK